MVLAFLFCVFAISPLLLMVSLIYRQSHGGSDFSDVKKLIPVVSGVILLLASLALLLAPTYFDAFNRAALLGQIYVEEHKEIIEADGAAMAIDTNREIRTLDMDHIAKFVDAQTGVRALTFGLLVRGDSGVLASSGMVPHHKVQEYVRLAKEAGKWVAFVDQDGSAVVSVVELNTPVADYLIVGRLINGVAVADWARVQNYIGGPTQRSGVWMPFAGLGLLLVAIVGGWWVATRISSGDRAQHSLNHEADRRD